MISHMKLQEFGIEIITMIIFRNEISYAHRYSIVGWSHDYDRIAYLYKVQQMLHRFIQVVNGQEKYNKLGQPADATPIIVYHRIDNSGARYSTTVSLCCRNAIST